jgi:hypothetical protein
VASDLHAHPGLSPSPSHLDITQAESLTLQHPISALRELIRSNQLKADLLVSPGDLGDKADPSGIAYAWSVLGKLSVDLECKLYTATAGNHDLDSRQHDEEIDPRSVLQGLNPPFPLQEEVLCDRFWARGYAIKDMPPLRLVLLNSSAYHGYTEIEKNHGRVSDLTLTKMAADLDSLEQIPINVLLCHHHPHQHSELKLGEDDVMKNGQQLLDLLGSGKYGRWLVIHGHKHHPKIAYAAGGSSSPVVFAAGSLSAILTGTLQTAARNQFYLIELDTNECAKFGFVGRVRAWDWSAGIGWIESNPTNSGLPARFGFGNRMDPAVLASKISQMIEQAGNFLNGEAISTNIPELNYLLPQDLKVLVQGLRKNHGQAVDYDGTQIVQAGKL